jgi:starch synthase
MPISSQARTIENIWMVTREYDGLAGTGGVKDVSRQLAEALVRVKKEVTVILPLYGFIDPQAQGFFPLDGAFDVDMNYVGVERREDIKIWTRQQNGVRIFLVDANRYREKGGVYTYTAEEEKRNPLNQQGTAYHDYFAMNVLLQKATLALIIILDEKVDVIHCQDGHTALLPAMIRECEGFRHFFRNAGAVVTIHNAGQGYHQEVGDLAFAKENCGLPYRFILDNLLDGKFNPFLAASSYAVLNTVSENYARELQETDEDALTGWLGHRLLTRGVHLEGVTNGINPQDFSFAFCVEKSAKGVRSGHDACSEEDALTGKAASRQTLLRAIGKTTLPDVEQFGTLKNDDKLPLFTMVGRLTPQKGVDILLAALQKLLPEDKNFQVLIQGSGSRDLEEELAGLAENGKFRGRVCYLRGYSSPLAQQIYEAGDFFLIPSKYEPCGLTDFIAQLAGNIPIVHHVGGLVKVVDGVTGFAYHDHSPEALMSAMLRGLRFYRERPRDLRKIQKAAVAHIYKQYTWDQVVQNYLRLYQTSVNLLQGTERERRRALGRARVRAGSRVLI